jgi:disulfide bond formation protein DsbB
MGHWITALKRWDATAWLWAVALLCVASLGAGLIAQHGFDMRPCPWCVLQRIIFLLIGALAVVAALWRARWPRVGLTLAVGLLALGGVATALYQHFVAAKSSSCALTFADKVLDTFGLEQLVPFLFEVTATCAEAANAKLLGLPFEFYSLALFLLFAVLAAGLLGRMARA